MNNPPVPSASPDRLLVDYYRCPESTWGVVPAGTAGTVGYFTFGAETTLYGRLACGYTAERASERLYDISRDVISEGSLVHLPFDPSEIVDALRYERYAAKDRPDRRRPAFAVARRAYYVLRPFMPVAIRRHLQKVYLRDWDKVAFPAWPVDATVDTLAERLLALRLRAKPDDPVPFIWFWPRGATACLIVTHDVETQAGRDFCPGVMDLDESVGIKSSFQLIPEQRYAISTVFRQEMARRGFEVNLHDLDHTGSLFSERQEFLRRAKRINAHARAFEARGFRSGALYRNLDWYDALEVSYDMSVPNVAHLEPQRGGCCTVMPYFVGRILELPLTTTQDYTLFHILGDYSLNLWRRQIELILAKHGLISIAVHPDYIIPQRARAVYRGLLDHLSRVCVEQGVWCALPGEVDTWWRQRSEMKLVRQGEDWTITGPGSERATLAYAALEKERVVYRVARAGTVQDAVSASTPQPRSVNDRRRLRVCMVTHSFYEHDTRVMQYARALAERGDDVDVISLKEVGQERTAIEAGVRVTRIQTRSYKEKGRATFLARIMLFFLKAMGVLAWRQLRAPYDFVHVHSVPDFLVFAAWAPKLGGAALMLDIHDVLPEFYASKFKIDRGSSMFRALLTAERLSCAFADHVIAANHLWQKKLESRAVPPGKSSVFLNYPNRSMFYRRERTAIPGRFRIIFPGSLNSHQGVDLAILAFATVCKQVPEAEFHIYGEGGAKESLVELARSLHLEDRVFFHKFVPLREIAPIMAEADLAVVPKRSDSFGDEAFSTKILEFMTLGVPVIVSDTKIDRYYFNDSVVRFFRGGDHEDLAAAILQLVKAPGLRERIERNAAEFVTDFDWASKKNDYFKLVDSLTRLPHHG